MGCMPPTKQPRQPEVGPIGRNLIRAVERLRERRGLTYKKLSELLEATGRPIFPLGLSRLEKGERRVDVDELVALAAVLGVSPATLLFPRDADESDLVEVAPDVEQRAWIVWEWMSARDYLPAEDPGPFLPHEIDPEALADFRENTLPALAVYAKSPLVVEVEKLLVRAKMAARYLHADSVKAWEPRLRRQLERVRLAIDEMVEDPPPAPEDPGVIYIPVSEGDESARLRSLAPQYEAEGLERPGSTQHRKYPSAEHGTGLRCQVGGTDQCTCAALGDVPQGLD